MNDHPSDKASYDVRITVPAGLEAVSNGVLVDTRTRNGWTSWKWRAKEPMASYLATATIGEFELHSYRSKGISFLDAIDPDLFDPVATPTTGTNLLISAGGRLQLQAADPDHQRSRRRCPAVLLGHPGYRATPGTSLLSRRAPRAGRLDHAARRQRAHQRCRRLQLPGLAAGIHPFLAHYQTDNGDGTCSPSGTTGSWLAATGKSAGPEQWKVDLSPFAGQDVEVSISYASDEVVQTNGCLR